ncbi:MAG: ATP-binding protein [Deltaproteobacteria bacterium]|nr:ATP-binding protein [Deltaproteobacteria bacterium]
MMQQSGIAPAPDDPYPGALVSPLLVEARLRAREAEGAAPIDTGEAEALLGRAREASAAAMAAASSPRDLPLEQIRRDHALDDTEYLALLLGVAAATDPAVAPLMAYLQGHYERAHPTLALLADCLGELDLRLDVRRLLDPDAPLVAAGLVRVDDSKPALEPLHRPYRVEPRVLRHIEGRRGLDASLAGAARLEESGRAQPEMQLGPDAIAAWDRLRMLVDVSPAEAQRLPVICLRGPVGAGKRRWAYEIASHFDLRMLTVDVQALALAHGPLAVGLPLVMREAVLTRSLCCLVGWDALMEVRRQGPADAQTEPARELDVARAVAALDGAVVDHRGIVVLCLTEAKNAPPALRRAVELIDVPAPDRATSEAIWSQLLPPASRDDDLLPAELARQFRLTPGRAADAVAVARRDLTPGMPLDAPRLTRAIKQQVQASMGSIARLRHPEDDWDDLVTTPEVGIQLRELCHRYRYRQQVLEDWGLASRFGATLGISALFEGPPGTGKTMSAGIIARELGLDLYQIELSQMVSKWLGETEKNLAKVFDEAERSGAMLLFDEADSLFSKRTSVSSSNDRYANLEVNYLLQRIERFTGVALLTTNFADSIDSAFARRLSMRVTFPPPELPERKRLWETMLAEPRLPLGKVDCEALAEEFELAGGLIRNAVLRAAFLAASREIVVDHELLRLSARIEMKEQGMLIRGNPHHEILELLMRPPSVSSR